eukprot:CAMPEP_0170575348 /NCGR_PEP_ID=MMETSP0224-20130122/3815_1 /TAXON_ID=285029 /ORGANISM="Togula jolla, Strain CCCM 725" /LENGTH=210 /DNA_ID=CAMNT_0010898125 /DNA_START=61 /DNA_END=693 /DNA_ORIENTATION=+
MATMVQPALCAFDVDQLAQLLRECNLHEETSTVAQALHEETQAAQGQIDESHVDVGSSQAHAASPTCPPDAALPLAAELVERLQGCASLDMARELCRQCLVAFHEQESARCQATNSRRCATGAGDASVEPCHHHARLQSLQGANRVIVRALRVLSERQRAASARMAEGEETVAQLHAELLRCREELRASERDAPDPPAAAEGGCRCVRLT